MPRAQKEALFTSLIIKVCGTLRSRDSGNRDIARESLAEMVLTMGLGSLKSVVYELQQQLTEGFQRHICNYTVRSVLTAVLIGYSPPINAVSLVSSVVGSGGEGADGSDSDGDNNDNVGGPVSGLLDLSIPLILNSVMDDLTGEAHEDRDVDDVKRKLVREAKGSKANGTLDLCARNILFRPTYAIAAAGKSMSKSKSTM